MAARVDREAPGPRADDRPAAGGGLQIRHSVSTSTALFRLCLVAPPHMSRRRLGETLADAVAELRAMDTTFSPARRDSLVSRVRRGELAPDSYPPLNELVRRCAAMRAATDGWFDAWAVPGGFDPSGLLKGWAAERAAARLRAAGIADFALTAGADVLVAGHAPHGGPWRVGIRHPQRPQEVVTVLPLTDAAVATSGTADRRGHVVDPHTGQPATGLAVATVTGPDLSVANGYSIALYAAGPAGLGWFPTADGYRALVLDSTLRRLLRRRDRRDPALPKG